MDARESSPSSLIYSKFLQKTHTLYPDGKLETFPKVSEAILALMQNRVDAVVIDNEPAKRFVSQNRADLKILETPLSNEKYAISFPKGKTELVAKVNLCLGEMAESGTTAVVAKKLGRHFCGIEINQEYCLWAQERLHRADVNPAIQGYCDGVFWERNTLNLQRQAQKKSTANKRIYPGYR